MTSDHMKTWIPTIILAGVVMTALMLSGGEVESSRLRDGRFRVTVEEISSGVDYFIRRLRIRAKHASGIRLSRGDGGGSWLSLDHQITNEDGEVDVHVLMMCDMGHTLGAEHRSVTWVLQITNDHGARVGGPSRYGVPTETKLDDLVTLALPEGEFDVGTSLTLGEFQGESIVLTIER